MLPVPYDDRMAGAANRSPLGVGIHVSARRKLVPSRDLIDRTIEAEASYTLSRLKVLEAIPGNPIGVAYRRLEDNLVALMARHLPVPHFNSVIGLRAGHERHIAPLAAWYRENDVQGWFEIVPGHHDASIGRELARLGYYQSDFHLSLVAEPEALVATPGVIMVEPVTDAALMEDYLDAYVAGWGIPAEYHAQFKANVRPWREQPGWSLYLARVDSRPAATATLFVQGATAYCADATTDPAFRRRGLHAALLHRRIMDAKAAGVDLVTSGAAFLSGSYRNMERLGMRLMFMRAIWTALPDTP